MIQGLIVKWIFGAIFKAIQKKREWKNLEKYMKEPNELDIKVKSLFEKRTEDLMQINSLNKTIAKYGKSIEEIEKNVAIVKKDAHPPIFSEKDKKKIWKKLKKLEKRSK